MRGCELIICFGLNEMKIGELLWKSLYFYICYEYIGKNKVLLFGKNYNSLVLLYDI